MSLPGRIGNATSEATIVRAMREHTPASWLFPSISGRARHGALDPVDANDRSELIAAQHPDLVEELGGENRARAHLALHELVAGQLLSGELPEVWATAQRLSAAGHDRHDICHMLAAAWTTVFHDAATRSGTATDAAQQIDLAAYRVELDRLPESWLALDEDDEGGEDFFDAALSVLEIEGAVSRAELAARLGLEEELLEALERDREVVLLDHDRLASLSALLSGVTLTHVLSAAEIAADAVLLDGALAPVGAWLEVCDAELAAGLSLSGLEPRLAGLTAALPALSPGMRLGIRLGPDVLSVLKAPEPTVPDDLLADAMRRCLERFGLPEKMPLGVLELLCSLLVELPEARGGVLSELDRLCELAGLELRGDYVGRHGVDWEDFDRTRELVSLAAMRDLEGRDFDRFVVLAAIAENTEVPALDRELADRIAGLIANRAILQGFADFCELNDLEARRLIEAAAKAASREERALLTWAASALATRAGDPIAGETAVRQALVLDPDFEPAIEDAAWYASDRGDAAQAVALLERLEDDALESRIDLLRRYLPAVVEPAGGRNAACPCGSGRKFKQCCLLGASRPQPLPARVAWLWEKLVWWLEWSGSDAELAELAEVMLGGRPPDPIAQLVELDRAASFVLFVDGAIADFLDERGALLPDDEHNLLGQWALSGHSVYEVSEVRAGEGVTLRDLRSGERVEVAERQGSLLLKAGDLLLAHAVFDGAGYQFVGGIQPLPLAARDAAMAALDAEVGAEELAELIGELNAPPTMVNGEGEAIVLCEAVYAARDEAALSQRLDALLERGEEGHWEEWIDVGGQRVLRATVRVSDGELRLLANSPQRFERLSRLLAPIVDGRELIAKRQVAASEIASMAAPQEEGSWADPPAEVSQALAAFVADAEARWVDEPVPALGGLTPRQAADDPTRREQLVALLHEFDRQSPPPGAVSFDTGRLRARLGLESAAP